MLTKNIISKNNLLFKDLKKIVNRNQFKGNFRKIKIEGINLCKQWMEEKGNPDLCIFEESAYKNNFLAKMIKDFQNSDTKCFKLKNNLFKTLTDTKNGINIFFIINMPVKIFNEKLKEEAIMLDGIQDPGNLGSILRTSALFGVKKIFCSNETANAWSQKVIRAGSGAHFFLDIYENIDLSELLLKTELPVFATCPHSKNSIYDFDFKKPNIWLFGNEGNGISKKLVEKSNYSFAIPKRFNIESINVAACVAICLFEKQRQKMSK